MFYCGEKRLLMTISMNKKYIFRFKISLKYQCFYKLNFFDKVVGITEFKDFLGNYISLKIYIKNLKYILVNKKDIYVIN